MQTIFDHVAYTHIKNGHLISAWRHLTCQISWAALPAVWAADFGAHIVLSPVEAHACHLHFQQYLVDGPPQRSGHRPARAGGLAKTGDHVGALFMNHLQGVAVHRQAAEISIAELRRPHHLRTARVGSNGFDECAYIYWQGMCDICHTLAIPAYVFI